MTASLAGCGGLLPGSIGEPANRFGVAAAQPVDPVKPGAQAFLPGVASILGSRPVAGNAISFFTDKGAFDELESLLASARKSIVIATFRWHMDESGLRLADLVARKKAAGVDVRVLIDTFGQYQGKGHDALLPWLVRHGVAARYFPRKITFPRGFLNFSHRKLYLVDGDRALIGSMNIGHEYEHYWHDALARVEGPIAAQLFADWHRDWQYSGGMRVTIPPVQNRPYGESTAVAVETDVLAGGRGSEIKKVLLAGIAEAKTRIWCGYPYWGDSDLSAALVAAKKRGVDVRVLVPRSNDTPAFEKLNKIVLRDLLENGVAVRWWVKNFAHIKYAVVDSMTLVGSSNADRSCFEYNQELDLATPDPVATEAFVKQVPAADWAISQDVQAGDLAFSWKERPEAALINLLDRYL